MAKRKLSEDPIVRLFRTHGIRETHRAATFAVCWLWLGEELGRRPEMTEYVKYWKVSERAAYRQRKAFSDVTGIEKLSDAWAALQAVKARIDFEGKRPDPADGLGLLPMLGGI